MFVRMMKSALLFAMLVALFSACQQAGESGSQGVQEIAPSDQPSNADIIRNPVSADEMVDEDNVAKMEFKEEVHDFGTVREGEVVKHTFTFTNTGTVPLVINNAKSTCGCTVPKWPKEPIAPGESGKIKVRFNTKSKFNKQDKPVTITANTYPANTVVRLTGFVEPDKSTAEKQ
ncbi:MAG: DUF1573 domain-containing protein [Bacteroidota bacterium]